MWNISATYSIFHHVCFSFSRMSYRVIQCVALEAGFLHLVIYVLDSCFSSSFFFFYKWVGWSFLYISEHYCIALYERKNNFPSTLNVLRWDVDNEREMDWRKTIRSLIYAIHTPCIFERYLGKLRHFLKWSNILP